MHFLVVATNFPVVSGVWILSGTADNVFSAHQKLKLPSHDKTFALTAKSVGGDKIQIRICYQAIIFW